MRHHIAAGCLALLLAAPQAHAGDSAPPLDGPVRMTPSQIAEYNATLGPSDPAYIKCVRTEPPGSLVKRKVCRTNADWDSRASVANQDARDIVDRLNTSGSTHGQEPPGSTFPVGGL